MTQAISPIITPHTILMGMLGSGLSGEIPVEHRPLIADVFESEETESRGSCDDRARRSGAVTATGGVSSSGFARAAAV